MDAALGEALVIASAGILSVGQILLVLVLLASAGGLRKASAFVGGMSGVLFALGVGALLFGSRVQAEADGPGATPWISLVLGALLLGAAAKTLRSPPAADAGLPKLLGSLDAATPVGMLGLGALVGGVNVKNLAIYMAAVDVLVRARVGGVEAVASLLAVTGVFCSGLLTPIAAAAIGGRRAAPALARFRRTLEANHRPVTIGVLGFFGVAFVVRGVLLLGG